MSNIQNNNYRKIDCNLIHDVYMDFMISKDNVETSTLSIEDYATHLSFNIMNDNPVVSNITWENAVESSSILNNIGYTGVDNGFISYYRDRIGNDEFLDLYTKSTFDLSKYGKKFFVSPVKGNTGQFVYPIETNGEYVSLKGGFYQGFFKIDGDNYQTLPHQIHDEWNFNFTIRRKDYKTPINILNNKHKDNDGIFFFIGTRAENKFWEMYKYDPKMEKLNTNTDNYSLDYDITHSKVNEHQYFEDEPYEINDIDGYSKPCNCIIDDYFLNEENPYIENDMSDDNYFANNEYVKTSFDCPENNMAIDENYIQEQMSLDNISLTDSKGNLLGEKGFYEIETDNKFIIFNQTKNGFNYKTWKDFYKYVLTGKKDSPNINYFPYLNRTKDGYTKKNIENLNNEHSYAYDIFKEIEYNALALKTNKDGSISYRYLAKNGEIIQETSKKDIIKSNQWVNIHLKIVRKPYEPCANNYKQGIMQLYIYVDGFLKMVSKELPELILKPLNDTSERQEGVPFTISIGGGSQGLSERIMLDYYKNTDYVLPIEKNFAGSFIGDIKNFSFIPTKIDLINNYQKIKGF